MRPTLTKVQLTPLKIKANSEIAGVGTVKGQEIYPTTPSLLKEFGFSNAIIETLSKPGIKELVDPRLDGLRPYQVEDIMFLLDKNNAGCFNEPRTGKTVTALKTFELKGVKKFLIIAPSSALYSWRKEIETWTDYKATLYVGDRARRNKIRDEWTEGALIMTYDVLKEKNYGSHSLGDIEDIVKVKGVTGVILDEAHRIRNRKIATTKAIFKLKNIEHKLILTGTSVIRKSEELWPLLHFLYPKVFTSYWKFVYYYFNVVEEKIYKRGGPTTTLKIKGLRKEQELLEFLDKVSTNRKRADVMSWLPDKDYEDVYLDLTDEQARYIKELREFFETEHIITQGVLDTLIRERQICLTPALLALDGGSPKITWLKQFIADHPDKPILIFSKFTEWLNILSKELDIPYMITGQQSSKDREVAKELFQAGKINQLLLNIDAAKEALTLDRAEAAIFTDKFQPIGFILQAEDRFVTTKESAANKPHTIYTLIMKKSYEENIIASLKHSKEEIDVVNDYKKYLKGGEKYE